MSSYIRDDMIFGLALLNPDRFGNTIKQINNRSGVTAKCVFINYYVRFGAPVEIYMNFKCIFKVVLSYSVQAIEVEKQKLLRKTKVFKKQLVTRE